MSTMENFTKLNAPTLRADKREVFLQACKDILRQRVVQILGISATAISLSTSPAFSEVANCEEFRIASPALSPAVCSSHTYVFPESYVLDTYPIKNRIYEIFGDENGKISEDTTQKLVNSFVIELESDTFIFGVMPWIQEIHKYTGIIPSHDTLVELINLRIYLKKGDYTTAKSLIEGIVINAQSPFRMEKAFDGLDLIPDEV